MHKNEVGGLTFYDIKDRGRSKYAPEHVGVGVMKYTPEHVGVGVMKYTPDFGTATKKGQLIKGDVKCTGCILSANSDGTDVKLVGWDIWEH